MHNHTNLKKLNGFKLIDLLIPTLQKYLQEHNGIKFYFNARYEMRRMLVQSIHGGSYCMFVYSCIVQPYEFSIRTTLVGLGRADSPSPACRPPSAAIGGMATWAEADVCAVCTEEFSFFFRRHQCRYCGESVCDDHSKPGKQFLKYIGNIYQILP
eukprot:SAG22_NODE_1428_length_4445_cov_1.417663_4_plen_155_part_00